MNRYYRVRGIPGVETCIEILGETAGGFEARITSTTSAGIRESFESIADEMLESCVRTGYLEPIVSPIYNQAVLSA